MLNQIGPQTTMPPSWRPRSSTLLFRCLSFLVLLDLGSILLPFTATALWIAPSTRAWMFFAAALLPAYLVVAFNQRAYVPSVFREPFHSGKQAGKALALSLGVIILIAFYLKSSDAFPRLTIAIGSACGFALLILGRYWFALNLTRLIGGDPFTAVLIREANQPIPAGDFSVIIAAEDYFDPRRHDPEMYDRFANTLKAADRVIVACAPERRVDWAHMLQGANIQGEIAMPELAELAPLGIGPDRDGPSVIVATGPLNLLDRAMKRAFDVTFSTLALVVLAPLLVGIAIWIRFDSPGPILFRQTRIGRGNEHFQMLKFRSMRAEACDASASRLTVRDDDRVTRVGRFIRQTSIDELPQLVNVLLGDMSIVGPRPHALGARAATKLYWEVDQRYWHRHAAKPGLTGLAQVRGFRGNTLEEDDLRNRLHSDLEYLEAWSIMRDLKIIFLTATVLFHRNAF